MGERDAFGREIGEDSLAEMGWSTSAAPPPPPVAPAPAGPPTPAPPAPSAPRAEPAAAGLGPPPPASPPPAGAAPPPLISRQARPAPIVVRRRRRGGSPVAKLIMFIAIAGVAVSAGAIEAGRRAIDDFRSALPSPDSAVRAAPQPRGLGARSLLRPGALQTALARLPDGRLVSLRVAPERIDAQIARGGRFHLVQVTSDARVTDSEAPVSSRQPGLRVDAAAPSRLVRVAARRSGRSATRVSYLVLLRIGDATEWHLYFDDGMHYAANSAGRRARRV